LAFHSTICVLAILVVAANGSVVPAATSYRANLGISVDIWPPSATVESTSQLGAFVNGQAVSSSSFSDGLSHTALFSERVLGDQNPAEYVPFRDVFATGSCPQGTLNLVAHCGRAATRNPPFEYSFLGGSWLLGGWSHTWYNHVLPPNSITPDCGYGPVAVDGGATVMTARSFHDRGVNVAMADGAVRFVATTIGTAVWHAVGTRNGREPANNL
jgi:prepilin-type processing-associated H-X9-DG protein